MNRLKSCSCCGIDFATNRKQQRFCSKRCSALSTFDHSRRVKSRLCVWCKIRFTPKISKKICCSRSCAGRHSHRNDILIPAIKRFWSHVNKTKTCWIWTAAIIKTGKGYGVFGVTGNKTVLAHRFSWEHHNGSIPDGMEVCHNCPGGDNSRCVNPAHLFLGTHATNMADASNKGQFKLGKDRKGCKLSDDQIRKIRSLRANTNLTFQAIADRFNVSYRLVWDIVNKRRRQHVI